MNSITNWAFSNFKVQLCNNYQLGEKLQQEVSPNKAFQIKGEVSKVSLFLRDQRYSDAWKISTDFDAKCNGSE